jgi:hypothetical protein
MHYDLPPEWVNAGKEIEAQYYHQKAGNRHAKNKGEIRMPEELLDLIEARGCEVVEALKALPNLEAGPGRA